VSNIRSDALTLDLTTKQKRNQSYRPEGTASHKNPETPTWWRSAFGILLPHPGTAHSIASIGQMMPPLGFGYHFGDGRSVSATIP
jgi:hypothetical protein